MPGGAGLVAIKDTKHPQEVARVMEYLGSEDVHAEFSERTMFLPAHKALAEKGSTSRPAIRSAAAALQTFARGAEDLAARAASLRLSMVRA